MNSHPCAGYPVDRIREQKEKPPNQLPPFFPPPLPWSENERESKRTKVENVKLPPNQKVNQVVNDKRVSNGPKLSTTEYQIEEKNIEEDGDYKEDVAGAKRKFAEIPTDAQKVSNVELVPNQIYQPPRNIVSITTRCKVIEESQMKQVGVENGTQIFQVLPSKNESEVIHYNKELMTVFISIIQYLSKEIFSSNLKSVSVYIQHHSRRIAFNRDNHLFFNMDYFQQWQFSKDAVLLKEAFIFWFFVWAHELAHNIASDHSKEHEYAMFAISMQYFDKLLEKIPKFPQVCHPSAVPLLLSGERSTTPTQPVWWSYIFRDR